jgi:hypothetical protein
MSVFDRLAEAGHHHDRAFDTMENLPSETLWAVAVDAEYSRIDETVSLDGVLSHDGVNLRFLAWSGRRILDAPFEEILVLRCRNKRLHLKAEGVSIKFEPFLNVSEHFSQPIEFAVQISSDDAFGGLLSWLPSAANLL